MSEDKPTCCECCYYETVALMSYTKPIEKRKYWFCYLCAGSLASQTIQYQHLFEDRIVVGVVMNAANHILAELKQLRESIEAVRP